MKSLFIGIGKSNTSLAKIIDGEKWALDEGDEGLRLLRWENQWILVQTFSEDLDSFNFFEHFSDLKTMKVFVSPGIDPRRPFFLKIEAQEVRELDYFYSHFKGKSIVITGTNGKSTFTYQLGFLLQDENPFVGGNLGTPVGEALGSSHPLAVVEVSSFQAERLKSAHFDLAILLNLDEDHLDRYNSLNDYHEAKWNLLRHADEVVYPNDVKKPSDFKKKSLLSFSQKDLISNLYEPLLQWCEASWGLRWLPLNLQRLPVLPHRTEIYEDTLGHRFIDDSKATNVHSTSYALGTLREDYGPFDLILGGRAKGDSFTRLLPLLKKEDKIFAYGELKNQIAEELSEFSGELKIYPTLKNCLDTELSSRPPRRTLLLSPGGSSYDEFNNYEERGRFFVETVKKNYGVGKINRRVRSSS